MSYPVTTYEVLQTNLSAAGTTLMLCRESWKHSSFGNKIVQAAEWRSGGIPIRIVSEQHWRQFLV